MLKKILFIVLFVLLTSNIIYAKNIMVIDSKINPYITEIKNKQINKNLPRYDKNYNNDHGTQMSYVIAHNTDEKTKIYSYCLQNSIYELQKDIEEAFRIAKVKHIDIICLSYEMGLETKEGLIFNPFISKAFINNLINIVNRYPKILLCVAGGNFGQEFNYDINCDNLLIVGSTNVLGGISSYSNTGSIIDLYCRGEGILTVNYDSCSDIGRGTSFSNACMVAEINNLMNDNKWLNSNNIKNYLKKYTVDGVYVYKTFTFG